MKKELLRWDSNTQHTAYKADAVSTDALSAVAMHLSFSVLYIYTVHKFGYLCGDIIYTNYASCNKRGFNNISQNKSMFE